MIIQCEQCSTRFRLADEKLKPSGSKVRCSKCKHVFTVMPPTPEPEEETVDFDAMNMEAVSESSQETDPTVGQESSRDEDDREGQAPSVDGASASTPDQASDEAGLRPESSFSSLLTADKPKAFSFESATRSGLPEKPSSTESEIPTDSDEDPGGFAFEDPSAVEAPPEEFSFGDPGESPAPDFPDQPAVDEKPEGFDFDSPPSGESAPEEFSFGEPEESVALDFEDGPVSDQDPEDFDFDDSPAGGATAEEFSFEEPDKPHAPDIPGEPDSDSTADNFGLEEHITEFSFDDNAPSDESPATDKWGEDTTSTNPFDFDEPAFEATAPADAKEKNNEDGLQFGEIDLPSEFDGEKQDYDIEEDFSTASLAREEPRKEETAESSRQQESSPPRDIDHRPLPAPPIKRKSPLSKIMLLLVLLLLALCGAAAYFYVQDGSLDLTRIMQRFTGESQPAALEQSINLKITESHYVKNIHVGQLLVVQGQAVNNSPTSRSAITVKGILLDANGKTLFQQTVSCGNPLNESTVKREPFAKIEEAMNNQFGDSLSNMNVAPGSSIPFTIVFRNLPDGIASINVEVVSSKPGSS